ncbi:carotenoid biosynthesis protein [Paenibacillus sp. P22]|uniref:carotenoid biosynthesis protein n=1 Tax=Paenibacillus sp. P22 TaxID=483908 RepID=UPI0035B55E58
MSAPWRRAHGSCCSIWCWILSRRRGGFWHWQDGGAYYGIPAANFAGWFVVGALLSLLLPSGNVLASARFAALRVMQGMLLLFGLLAAKAGMMPVFLLSLLVMAAAEGRVRFDSGR